MGRSTMIDPCLIPKSCRELVSLPYDAGSDVYTDVMQNITVEDLTETLQILLKEYPGKQMHRKQRIRAEINRRAKNQEKTGFERAILPRRRHWAEDFTRLWNEACRPFREARL